MADFNIIVNKTFSFEGGYQAFPNDSANYCDGKLIGTNHGISAVAYKGYLHQCPTVDQIKSLSITDAKNIYKNMFWNPLNGDSIRDQSLAHIMFDTYIASGGEGLKRIKKYINTQANIFSSIDASPITNAQANAINTLNSAKLFDVIKAGEKDFRNQLAIANPQKYGSFLKGWLNRLDKITYTGVEFVKRNWVGFAVGASALAAVLVLLFINKKKIQAI